MKRLKAIISYDGTAYHGWQIQPHAPSVAAVLQKTFEKTFKKSIIIVGASRTDTGVHALGQVARCVIPEDSPAPEQLLPAWNNILPHDILIRSLSVTDDSFHPCAKVREKTYYYLLFLKPPLPFIARYGWLYPFINEVDLVKFSSVLQCYQGTHDFASFCKQEPDRSTIRTINSVSIQRLRHWNALLVAIKGPGFGRFQIRRMIGYALDIARNSKYSVDYINELLKNPNPEQRLCKAGASGLCLKKIIYER